jgi:hypothetical protein
MAMSMSPRDDGDAARGSVDLWAMAAELERQFAGYKQRFAQRTSTCDDDDDGRQDVDVEDHDGDGVSSGEEEEARDVDGGVRGRMYEAYTRRRDERLRAVWRARMERKEAEVMALWARLQGGGGPTAGLEAEDDDGAAGEVGNSVTHGSMTFSCLRSPSRHVRALLVSFLRPVQLQTRPC